MRTLTLLSLVLSAAACGPAADLPDEIPTSGQRVELPTVHFNKWTDFLSLQAGLTDDCRFLSPLVDDDSTAWPPLQVFWVIYDNVSDVKDGDSVADTFFLGDRITAADFPELNGGPALGFKFLPPSQRVFLDIETISVSDDGTGIDAKLGGPLDTRLLVQASPASQGCEARTEWCSTEAEACEPRPLSSIDIELNGLNLVKDIVWNE